MRRGLAAALVVAGLTGIGTAFAFQNQSSAPTPAEGAETTAPAATSAPAAASEAPSQDRPRTAEAPALSRSAVTPMKDRVAVIGLLNKRNGLWRDLTLRPGQAVRVGDVVVRLRACEATAPWETQTLTGAFVQTDVRGSDGRWKRVFSGWLFKESPSLNVVEHPIYDVWPKSCTMRYPDVGADTVMAGSVGGGNRSSAKKSAETEDGAVTPAPTVVPAIPKAASSNPT